MQHFSAAAPSAPLVQHRMLAWAARAVAVLATLAVFALYTRPEFMVMLADQLWSCF
ncbi:MAG: hypothetical protein KA752_07650 [Giesbergeria sp.]|nr:hypothetical protein [Giesbergeria sp.]